MNNQTPSANEADVDCGKALRFVRHVRRCLPEINVHWVEAGYPRCQCGKVERLARPQSGTDTAPEAAY